MSFTRDSRKHTSMIVRPEANSISDPGSFLTVPDLKNATPPPQHVMIIGQLNCLIDTMDNKIQDVINRHEAEFLFAYRNHMTRVKEELEAIRSRAAAVQANSNSLQRINLLEKQLVLFREESLKLYDRLEEKTSECDNLKMRLQEVGSQNNFLEAEVKKLMKRLKMLEAQRSVLDDTTFIRPMTTFTQKPVTTKHLALQQNSLRSFKSGGPRARSNYTRQEPEPEPEQQSKQLVQLKPEVTQPQLPNARKINRLNQKYRELVKISSYSTRVTSDLERYFLECVESVRREIVKRKGEYSFNPDFIDFSTFRKADNMQVLEILVSHPRVRDIVYGEIFKQVANTSVFRQGVSQDRPRISTRHGSHTQHVAAIQ